MERKCDNCGVVYIADLRNIKRGWGLCCSKSCAASKREKSKHGYNKLRVNRNNLRRISFRKDENHYGTFRGKRTSEEYKIYEDGNTMTAVNEYGEAMNTIDEWDLLSHPLDMDY